MSVVVWIPTPLRKMAGGAREVSVEAPTVAAVIEALERLYPGMKEKLCQETGELHRFINVYVNGEDVRFLNGLAASLSDGDKVSIVPAVSGG